ncbi:hypothetical protein FT663_02849 [Candidozyma haemuli var. vulneris]|uniref:Transcription factor tau subunit sfc4 n=1 Tax=Candidozyma haemuli TaxID=45357 RepID=A0A2V1B2D1_9ASCO|nr:hypothetical protein CXQ85_003861 [[Candida] haemuloni]KAF3989302.1 hypothetical protein FT662_02946 [[Candida] haemuloni var. vulneris]KAF3991241.1 hypothetical protein FT663_02849 [[Candida] haemuloni var. vulneris]PVH23571.1 hypothetical protein CXQ85_003861 [[Candida] haemuloni]
MPRRNSEEASESDHDMDVSSDDNYQSGSEFEGGVISEDEEEIDPSLQSGRPRSKKTAGQNEKISELTRTIINDFEADDDEAPASIDFSDDDDDYVPLPENMDIDVDDDDDLLNNLRNAAHMKRKRPKSASNFKRQVVNNKDLDPEKRTYMSRGNEAFARGDLETAWKNYAEVIKIDNKSYNAYKTLAEICQMQKKYNKCCNYMLMGALSNPSDTALWGQAAELSAELGHVDQAIYCYTRAIATKNTEHDYEFIIKRSILYKQKGQYGRALEGLQRLNLQYPEDSAITKFLADVYVHQKRLNDAIALYNRILEKNMNPTETKVPRFSWSELNILTELYISKRSWVAAINTIKLVARWIQKRSDETWWDEQQDCDAEFDDRRGEIIMKKRPKYYNECAHRPHNIPIDIRFKLGYLRLELDQKDEALRHYDFLQLEEDKSEVSDLFLDAGKHLESKGYFEDAITYLREVTDEDHENEVEYLLGKCYAEIKEYSIAKIHLLEAMKHDRDNNYLKAILTEVLYYTLDPEDTHLAAQLMEEIDQQRTKGDEEEVGNEFIPQEDDDNIALIKNAREYKATKKETMTEEEREEIEQRATRMVLDKFNRMKRLQEAIDQGHKAAATAWMNIASQLIDMFTSTKAFFPKNRKSTFRGIVMYLRRKQDMDINNRLARINNLYGGITDTSNSRVTLTAQTEFRGLTYDQWLYIFIQNALLVRQFDGKLDEAISILEVAFDVNVFIQDKARVMILRLVRLSLAINQQDFLPTVCNNIRYVLSLTQFSPTIYGIFMCCFGSGIAAWAAFSNYNHQKYFLRQLKAYDSLLTSSSVSGAAHVTVDVKGLTFNKELPSLLYIYACLLGSNRAYSSPIVYLTRAYKKCYNDPTICLMLGLAHVHRSMQRNSSNRHMQLLQGISFLLEYRENRNKNSTVYEKQEIEYNFGRLFHMLGLPALAIDHYNKVLDFHETLQDDPDYDLSVDAAYNLTLIYNINGNSKMTRELTDKYLTI